MYKPNYDPMKHRILDINMSLIGTPRLPGGIQSPGRMLDHGISETFVVLLPR